MAHSMIKGAAIQAVKEKGFFLFNRILFVFILGVVLSLSKR